MKLGPSALAPCVKSVRFSGFPRIIRQAYAATPLGLSSGPSRFSSPSGAFRVLYAAEDFKTALAEAVIRDRFVGRTRRYIGEKTLEARTVTLVEAVRPLQLLDIRGQTAYDLGIDTDTAQARDHAPGQAFSEALHAQTLLDGILYDSRLTKTACVAVYERAVTGLSASAPVNIVLHAELAPELERLNVIVRKP